MAVVVRTDDLTHEFILARQWKHLRMGGHVPVDTTPGPAPVCRALKIQPSAH